MFFYYLYIIFLCYISYNYCAGVSITRVFKQINKDLIFLNIKSLNSGIFIVLVHQCNHQKKKTHIKCICIMYIALQHIRYSLNDIGICQKYLFSILFTIVYCIHKYYSLDNTMFNVNKAMQVMTNKYINMLIMK